MLQDNKRLRKEVETGRRARSEAIRSLKQCADEMGSPDGQGDEKRERAAANDKLALNGNVAKARQARQSELETLRRTVVKVVDDIKRSGQR